MPKAPTFDRFEIRAEVGVTDLGPVMAQLAQIKGLTITGTELVTDVVRYKTNNRTHEISAREFIEAWSKEHPTFSQKEFVAALKADGRKKPAGYYALNKLVEEGVFKKLDDYGNYSRADVKHIEAPKRSKKPEKKPKKIERERHEVDHREFILRYMRNHHGRTTRAKLMAYFDLHGRKPSSVGGALNILIGRKLIKQLGSGEYELKVPKPKKDEEPPPKQNGNGAAVEEVTHG